MLSNPKKILGFDDRLYVIAGIILDTQTVMAIYYTGAFFKVKFSDYVLSWLGEFFIVLILWLVIRGIYIEIAKRYRGFKNVKKRLLFIPFLIIPYVIICLFYLEYVQHMFKWDYPEFPEPGIPVQLATGAIILIASLGFYECIFLVLELKNVKLKEERRKKESLNTQLLNLKHQISPHFLFNSLNTLVYLIDTDREKSKEFVYKLSEIYERVLEFSSKDLVSLQEELNYINAYVGLLEKRFGTNLRFEFNISKEATTKMIVPLSIQTGIENAVKHNIVSKRKPLHISIDNCGDYLIIKNNLQKKENTPNGSGQGLDNIKNRYRLLSNMEMVTEETRNQFTLKLPLIQPLTSY